MGGRNSTVRLHQNGGTSVVIHTNLVSDLTNGSNRSLGTLKRAKARHLIKR